jgi:hypothetical protein
MKKAILLLVLLSAILLIVGCCISTFFTKESFYQQGSEWDSLRFPLIEPYYAISMGDQEESGWSISLYGGMSIVV